MEVYFIVP